MAANCRGMQECRRVAGAGRRRAAARFHARLADHLVRLSANRAGKRGDLCDGLEIDEILHLRIMSLTDEEKEEMRSLDDRTRAILERTENLPPINWQNCTEPFAACDSCKERGRMDPATPGNCPIKTRRVESISLDGVDLKPGDRVRLAPNGRADIMDLALAGKIGLIEAIEQDFNDKIHLAIVLDDDPGRDLGMLRQPGHRFFFSLDEVEILDDDVTT